MREHAGSLPEEHPLRIEHFHYLKGRGAVSLVTDIDDVEVILEKYVPHHHRLVPKTIANLGRNPIISHSLEMGSYRLRLRKEGYHEVRYPVFISRGEHWDGVDPRGVQRPIHLPKLGELAKNDCYVPAGWFWAGGDKEAPRGLSRKRVWKDSFVLKKFPVTNREYLSFLDDLIKQGREEEALRYVPRERAGQVGQLGAMIYGRKDDGGFKLVPDSDGDMWALDWPVCMVNWSCSVAYAQWKSEKTRVSWRLPQELEWEKGARGVDGRFFVWGDGFDPSYACSRQSHRKGMLPVVIDSFPIDQSVYGIRGQAGNMSDWTGSVWSEDWSGVGISIEEAVSSYRVIRGGYWNYAANHLRTALRFSSNLSNRNSFVGFRLGRSVK